MVYESTKRDVPTIGTKIATQRSQIEGTNRQSAPTGAARQTVAKADQPQQSNNQAGENSMQRGFNITAGFVTAVLLVSGTLQGESFFFALEMPTNNDKWVATFGPSKPCANKPVDGFKQDSSRPGVNRLEASQVSQKPERVQNLLQVYEMANRPKVVAATLPSAFPEVDFPSKTSIHAEIASRAGKPLFTAGRKDREANGRMTSGDTGYERLLRSGRGVSRFKVLDTYDPPQDDNKPILLLWKSHSVDFQKLTHHNKPTPGMLLANL